MFRKKLYSILVELLKPHNISILQALLRKDTVAETNGCSLGVLPTFSLHQ